MVNFRLLALGFAMLVAMATSLVFMADCLASDKSGAQYYSGRDIDPFQRPVLRKHYPTLARDAERISFEAGESALMPVAIQVLNRQAVSIRAQPKAPVTIYGFADADEGEGPAIATLARRRAEVVRDYLIAKGLALPRLKIEVILPSASYDPPLANGWPRPTRYVLTRLSAWDE